MVDNEDEVMLDRLAEAQKRLDSVIAKRMLRIDQEKAKWKFYYQQLSKMPEYNPGSQKSLLRHSINNE